ncbi:MAG TPA: hypothetical protein VFN55_00055 [Solirubrobacteraceae bacterium]|nr:hypothetical protein [Solirubrobacteraceae bacterium]
MNGLGLIPRARLRRLSALSAVLVLLPVLAVGALHAAPASAAAPKLHFCRNVDMTVAVGESRVACGQARSVAQLFLAGRRHIQGFTCRRIAVQAAAGFYGVCTKRAQLIRVIPE